MEGVCVCRVTVSRWSNSRAEIESTSKTLLFTRIIWHVVTADYDSGSLGWGAQHSAFLSTSHMMPHYCHMMPHYCGSTLLLEPQGNSRVLDYISQFCNFN